MAFILDLPNELILLILSFCQQELFAIALTCKRIAPLAKLQLFQAPPAFTDPRKFDQFSLIVDQGYKAFSKAGTNGAAVGDWLQRLSITFSKYRDINSKGSAVHLMRFRHCISLEFIELKQLCDLRLKHLVGPGCLRTLRIVSTDLWQSSRANEPPELAQALANLTTLEVSDVIFPTSQHYITLVSACPFLTNFKFAATEKVTPADLCASVSKMKCLNTLELLVLTVQQHELLPTIISASNVPTLRHLTLTTPLGSNPDDLKSTTPLLESLTVKLVPVRYDLPRLVTTSIIHYLERRGHSSKLTIKLWKQGYNYARASDRFVQLLQDQTLEMVP